MNKQYCLTYEYPGICWAYKSKNPRIFYEIDSNYKMLKIPIKGIIKLTFKRWVDKDEIRYATK